MATRRYNPNPRGSVASGSKSTSGTFKSVANARTKGQTNISTPAPAQAPTSTTPQRSSGAVSVTNTGQKQTNLGQNYASGGQSFNPLTDALNIANTAAANNIKSGAIGLDQSGGLQITPSRNVGNNTYVNTAPDPGYVSRPEDYVPQGTNFDQNLPPDAKREIEYWQNMWNSTNDPALRAEYHKQAEAIRQRYGYLGGDDGSAFIPVSPTGVPVSSGAPVPVALQGTPEKRDYFYNFVPQQPQLTDINALNQQYLGNMNLDQDALLSIFQDATRSEFERKGEELRGAEAKFTDNLYSTQFTARDAIRRANASAVATGASRGVQAAQELASILGLEQESTAAATELAQARAALGLQEAEALSKDVVEALTYADDTKYKVGQIARDLYTADTQFNVGQMDYIANLENSIKNLEGVLAQVTGQTDVANINALASQNVAQIGAEAQTAAAQIDAEARRDYNEAIREGNLLDSEVKREANRISAKYNQSRTQGGSGTAPTPQEKQDYLTILNGYLEDGSAGAKSAYISTMTSMGMSEREATAVWDEVQKNKDRNALTGGGDGNIRRVDLGELPQGKINDIITIEVDTVNPDPELFNPFIKNGQIYLPQLKPNPGPNPTQPTPRPTPSP